MGGKCSPENDAWVKALKLKQNKYIEQQTRQYRNSAEKQKINFTKISKYNNLAIEKKLKDNMEDASRCEMVNKEVVLN